jgi:hypothetical protein
MTIVAGMMERTVSLGRYLFEVQTLDDSSAIDSDLLRSHANVDIAAPDEMAMEASPIR